MTNIENTVQRLCDKLFGRLPESMERCTVGMVNTVYILAFGNEKYVLRLNREEGAYRESARLLAEAESVGLTVPHIVAEGRFEGYEYMTITYLEGRDLGIVYRELSDAERRLIAAQTANLQRLAAKMTCSDPPKPWYGFVDEMLDRAAERMAAGGYFDPEKALRVKREAELMRDYFESLEPVAYLDDISTKNLLIDKGQVSGVIDIDEIGWGDPLTFIALTRTALLGMGCDDDICEYLLDAMGADDDGRRAEAFYSLLYCADLMSERGMVFDGRAVHVDEEVITRFNGIYERFWERRMKQKEV